MQALTQVDPINFSVARLELEKDGLNLGAATGFFYVVTVNGTPHLYLISNWHVFSGRHRETHQPNDKKNGALPNKIKMTLIRREPPQKGGNIATQPITLNLYDENDTAVWLQHPLGSQIDIAAIRLPKIIDEFYISGIADFAQQTDMAIEIGNDVLILGYPLGLKEFLDTPIWKKGIIASEPHSEVEGGLPRILIDATTRNGMSGSPVIMRAKTHYLTENGEVKLMPNATRLIGVYSSRPGIDELAAKLQEDSKEKTELGYVYKAGQIDAVIKSQRNGPSYGEMPTNS